MINKNLFMSFKSAWLFALIFLYVIDFFSPYMEVKGDLMGLDLSSNLEIQSSGSLFRQLFWIAVFLIGFFIFLKEKKRFEINDLSQVLFIFVILFILISSSWSEYTFISLKRGVFQILLIASVYFSLFQLRSKTQFLFILFILSLVLLVWELAFSIIFNAYAFESTGAMSGIHKGKNQFGVVAVLGVFVSMQQFFNPHYRLFKNDKIFTGLVVVLWIVLLLLTRSKTCIALGILLSLGFASSFMSFSLKVFSGLLVKTLIVFLIGATFYGQVQNNDPFSVFGQLFAYLDLTGRGEIWSLSLLSIVDKPILGYGYSSFWGVGEVPAYFDKEFSYLSLLNQSHNGYLDLVLQLGVVGFSLFIGFIWSLRHAIAKSRDSKVFYLCAFLFVILHNVTESSFLRDQHFTWFLFVMIFVSHWVFSKKI